MYRIAHTPRHREQRFMAAAPERSRRLHNFTLPELRWGNQRLLRCVQANRSNGNSRRSSGPVVESDGTNRRRVPPELIRRRSPVRAPESFKKSSLLKPFDGGDGNGIDAVREKLMYDLRVAADKMKVSILEEKELEESSSAARPWNLRTRRAACKAPEESSSGGGGGGAGGGNSRSEERQQQRNNNGYPSSPRPENPMTTAKSSRLRGLAAASAAMAATEQSLERREKEPRTKVSIPLSRSEIERDFLVMAGIKPPRRPKKRPRLVQRQVDACFPGLWLTGITPEKYKVPDAPESAKS